MPEIPAMHLSENIVQLSAGMLQQQCDLWRVRSLENKK